MADSSKQQSIVPKEGELDLSAEVLELRQKVAELQQRNAELEDNYGNSVRALEAEKDRVRFLEDLIDNKPELIENSKKVDELNQKLADVTNDLEEERRQSKEKIDELTAKVAQYEKNKTLLDRLVTDTGIPEDCFPEEIYSEAVDINLLPLQDNKFAGRKKMKRKVTRELSDAGNIEDLFERPPKVLSKKTSKKGSQSTSTVGEKALSGGNEKRLLGLTRTREWKSVSDSISGGTPLSPLHSATGLSIDRSQLMLTDEQKKKLDELSPSTESTYRLHLQTGIKASELATSRNLAESTVCTHLSYCALAGLPLHLEALDISKDLRYAIYDEINNKLGKNIRYLKSIMECFPSGFVDYNKLKIVVNILEYEYGIQGVQRNEEMEKKKRQETTIDLPASSASNGPCVFKKKKMAL